MRRKIFGDERKKFVKKFVLKLGRLEGSFGIYVRCPWSSYYTTRYIQLGLVSRGCKSRWVDETAVRRTQGVVTKP